MAEHLQQRFQQGQHPTEGLKSMYPEKGLSASKVLAVVTLLPIGGTLLLLAGITLTGTLIGLAFTTPLFVIFSPVLIPAALTIGLAVAGFLTSGAFGVTALSSMTWMINYLRRMRGPVPEQVEHAKRRVQDTAGHIRDKTKEMGQTFQSKAQEGGKT